MEQINNTAKTNLSFKNLYPIHSFSLKHLFFIFSFLASYHLSYAQNNLAAGDIAIVSYQSDADPTNTFDPALLEFDDRFSMVVLKSGGLAAGTVIYITSRGWDGPNNIWLDEAYPPNTFGIGSEAVVKWTVPAGGIIQGKEVFFIGKYHDELPAGSEYFEWFAYSNENGTVPLGTVTNETPIVPTSLPQPNGFTDGMSLYQTGGNILVFQTGPPAGAPTNYDDATRRFITAILANIRPQDVPPINNGTTYATWDLAPNNQNESSIPPGLVNGQTCFLMSPGPLPHPSGLPPSSVEPDNGKFSNCALSLAGTCTALQMSTLIYTTGNWTISSPANNAFPAGASSSLCTYNILSANTITLSSAVGTNAQTVCINTNITNITYNTTGATGATFSGLPSGVNGNWAGNVVTISGTPMVSGNFNYIITTTGGCSPAMSNGTITVNPQNTIAAGVNRTTCINTAITTISLATTNATGATFSGLPSGVTGSWSGNLVTISGTPMVSGSFNYTVTTTGGCPPAIATGNITVNALNTINLTSGVGTDAQSVLINTPIDNITYATAGATGATFSGLPLGVTGNWSANLVTISGSPSTAVSSPYNYMVTLTGGCGIVNASGTITVNTCSITEQTVSANPLSVCTGGSSTITVGASQPGVNYTLRIEPANTFVAGPTASNGVAIDFPVGPLASPTTYNILAETDKYSIYLNGGEAGFIIPQVASLDVTNNFTIEGWIKPDGISAAFSRMFNKSQSYALGLSDGQTKITFTRHNSGDYSVPFAFTSGQWYHIACTYVSGTVEFFVNGISVGTVGGVPFIATADQGAQIGSESSSFHQFKGNLDNVRIWNNVRTQAEINANQSAFLTSTGNPTLVASWWIIEGTGNAKDYSANVINATSLSGIWEVDSPIAPCSLVLTDKPTVNVNAIPNAVATPSSQTVCSDIPITTIVLSGAVGGTVFNWTRDNTIDVTGIAANGTGDISGTLTNITNSPITVTFAITPTAGCSGTPITATILVNPKSPISISGRGTFCGGSTTTLSVSVGFSSYSWTRFGGPGVLGTNQTLPVVHSGLYTAVATNSYNCVSSDTATVEIGDYIINSSLSAGSTSMVNRLVVNGTVSTCASPKTCPGNSGAAGPFVYNLHTITNVNPNPVCATIALNAICSEFTFSTVYLGSFNPANNCTNYLADQGSAIYGGTWSYEVIIPGGATIVIKINNFNSGLYCGNYRLVVDIPRVAPNISLSPSSPQCSGTPITLTASAANTYSWSPGGATTQSIIHNTGDTNYTVTLGYGNVGCDTTAMANAAVINSYSTIADGDYFSPSIWAGGCIPPNPIPNGLSVAINHNISNSGTITNNGIITNSGSFTNNGIYKGSGTFNGNFVNNGNVSPGN